MTRILRLEDMSALLCREAIRGDSRPSKNRDRPFAIVTTVAVIGSCDSLLQTAGSPIRCRDQESAYRLLQPRPDVHVRLYCFAHRVLLQLRWTIVLTRS